MNSSRFKSSRSQGERAAAAVYFKSVMIAPAGGVAGGFKRAKSAVHEFSHHQRGVLHRYRSRLRRILRKRTLFDEGFHQGGDGSNVADEIMRQVDGVRSQIPLRSGEGGFLFQFPVQRKIRIPPASSAGRRRASDRCRRYAPSSISWRARNTARTPAVVVVEIVHHAGFFRRRQHRLALFGRQRERLLAENMLARFSRGNRHLGVKMLRQRNIHRIHVVPFQHPAPVGFC